MFEKLKNALRIRKSDTTGQNLILRNGRLHLDIISMGRYLFGNLRLLVFGAIVAMTMTGLILCLVSDKYRSQATILPSGKTENLSLLKEMAGLAGFGIEGNESSSVLYPDILSSRQIKEAVINYRYSFGNPVQTEMTLKEYFDTSVNEHLLRKLESITSIDLDKSTGLITISVETKYPELSQAIVRRYLAELEDYNMYRRRSSARERVVYLERELAQRETELRQAEDDLEQYQMANRNWNMTSDPEILSNLNRKKREIMAKSETYLFLRNQYDLAKLEVQKDIPIVRVLDNPSLPLVKSGPQRLLITLLSGAIGVGIMSLFLIILCIFRNSREAVPGIAGMPVTARRTILETEEVNR
ncbi:MAG TPA: hypothetical protein ENL22_04265 [candidate division Zixibacteria bacterium]|nr:hypothetical protein [candidate division Zixibacteria bacterium]